MSLKNKLKKILVVSILASVSGFSVADNSQPTTKAQLLSSMSGGSPASAPGGLVSNNVVYSNSPAPQTSGINLLNSSNGGNSSVQKTNSTSKKKSSSKKKQTVSKISVENQRIDLTYFGDVSGVPNLITQYFPNLKVASPLGKSSPQNVSFDMQSVTIDDVSGMIQSLTGGVARLIYNANQNTIRVSYVTSNDSISPNSNTKLTPEQQSQNWRDGKGKPRPIMTDAGVLLYPYGQYEPTVICRPQQVCDIQFEAGENIIDAVMGDTSRWIVQGIVSGKGANSVKHIILKPQYPDLNTNMIVTTDKGRVYNLKLVSSERNYVSAVGWYYPQEINNKMMLDFNQRQQALGDNGGLGSSPMNGGSTNQGLTTTANGIQVKGTPSNDGSGDISALNLDFRYKISGDNVVWKPLRVFNDGVHTFIEVSVKALNLPSPAFMVYEPYSGNYEMVNYRQKGNYYIVDSVFNEGVLIYNVGSNQQKVSISHNLDTNSDNKNWLY